MHEIFFTKALKKLKSLETYCSWNPICSWVKLTYCYMPKIISSIQLLRHSAGPGKQCPGDRVSFYLLQKKTKLHKQNLKTYSKKPIICAGWLSRWEQCCGLLLTAEKTKGINKFMVYSTHHRSQQFSSSIEQEYFEFRVKL